jgi:ribonuclease D
MNNQNQSFDWINSSVKLQDLVKKLKSNKVIAVDTESNSLFAYQEQVCLIQFSTAKKDFLVDPLSIQDLTPLGEIFKDPKIEKIFHAAEYDIICMKRDFNFEFENLFDTMIASRILGRKSVGLAAMLEEELGIVVNKKYQRANWGMRPLTDEMLSYARYDTHYLIKLRKKLLEELREKGLSDLANEDFQRLNKINPNNSDNNGEDCWKVAKGNHISSEQAAILRELCHYRDIVAQKANLPLFKIISNKALINIAISAPESKKELYAVDGLSSRLVDRHHEGLLSAIQSGKQAPPLRRPPSQPRPSEEYITRTEALKDWRKNAAKKLDVESDVVMPREAIDRIAFENPKNLNQLQAVLSDLPFRFNRFGNEIVQVLRQLEEA